jgi:acylphosphatase
VTGWVRNCADGTVEAVFEGDPDAVAALIDWCRRGPRGADVSRVEVDEERPEGLARFEVR